jgi:hypothetical protein
VPNLTRGLLVAFACFAILATALPAYAARQPTFTEREALTAALPQWIRGYPVGCVWLKMTVANAGGYAKVTPVYLNATKANAPCAKYASNGFWILKKETGWRLIYSGSELPSCKLYIPRDLSRCSA